VHQPAQRARPGTLPAPAEPAGNAHQRRRRPTPRLPPGAGRRHGAAARHGQVPAAVGARGAGRASRRVRPRLHRRAHHGVDDYLAVVDATPWEQIEAQSGLALARSSWRRACTAKASG
jgi:hypothetical protein